MTRAQTFGLAPDFGATNEITNPNSQFLALLYVQGSGLMSPNPFPHERVGLSMTQRYDLANPSADHFVTVQYIIAYHSVSHITANHYSSHMPRLFFCTQIEKYSGQLPIFFFVPSANVGGASIRLLHENDIM